MQSQTKFRLSERIAASILCLAAIACSAPSGSSGDPAAAPAAGFSAEATAQIERLKAYNGAFNRHDVDAMMSMVSQDIEWLSVEGTTMQVEAQGAAAMRKSMNEYFSVIENPQSSLSGFVVDGPFVAVQETASWGLESERKSQSSLAVYEIENDKVRRVWYYPVR